VIHRGHVLLLHPRGTVIHLTPQITHVFAQLDERRASRQGAMPFEIEWVDLIGPPPSIRRFWFCCFCHARQT